MNAAEIKLDLFRRLDKLDNSRLEKVYSEIINLINTDSPYKLSKAEKAAIEKALKAGKDEQTYTQEEVMEEAKRKFPNLDFK